MKYLIVFLIAAVALSSCNIIDSKRVKGNGTITTQTYNLKNFSSVDVGNSIEVYIRQATSYSVKVETDENLFRLIDVEVHDGHTLEIEARDGFSLDPSNEIKVYISMPAADKISISGAAQLQTQGKFSQDKKIDLEISGASSGNVSVRAPVVEMEVIGASTLTIDGESRDIKAEAMGASTINAFNLKSENAQAEATGASTVRVFSSVSLKADASGASTIKYKGNPKITSDVSGASSVSKD